MLKNNDKPKLIISSVVIAIVWGGILDLAGKKTSKPTRRACPIPNLYVIALCLEHFRVYNIGHPAGFKK